MADDPENLSTEAGGSPPPGLAAQPPAPALAPKEIWKPRDLLLFVAIIPFALLACKLVVLMGYAALRPFTGWRLKVDLVQTETVFLLTQQCVFYVLILGFLFLLARLQHQQPFWKSVGWKKPTSKQVLGYLAGGGVLAGAVLLALALRPDTHGFPLEKLFNSPAASFAIGAFAISFAPMVEELVFRGLLFAILEGAMGLRFAVIATAVLFAGLHVPEYWHAWNHLFMILVVGLVFSLARGATGSIAPSILLHIGYNSLIMTGLFFSTRYFHTAIGYWAW
jgi:membrane protease YdiL (CAAX protease family)